MELTWDNLRKLFEMARDRDDGDAPYVDASDQSMVIDGNITREFVDRFITEQGREKE